MKSRQCSRGQSGRAKRWASPASRARGTGRRGADPSARLPVKVQRRSRSSSGRLAPTAGVVAEADPGDVAEGGVEHGP